MIAFLLLVTERYLRGLVSQARLIPSCRSGADLLQKLEV
jgi:hypothetical protein